MDINTIGIVGAGQMGVGISQVFCSRGFKVVLTDVSDLSLKNATVNIRKYASKLFENAKITQAELENIMGSVKVSTDIGCLKEADFVIEAAPENMAIKSDLFSKLDHLLNPNVILASNTSSLSISELGFCTQRVDKVVGMHFMNPAPIMKCVEVVKGEQTSSSTLGVVSALVKKIDKIGILVNDSPGFIVNRILIPMINEAVYVLDSGIATAEDIDLGMKLSCNLPMGPLALGDFIGLDTVLAILNVLYHKLKDEKYKPCKLLDSYVDRHLLGKKTKAGFYKND